MFFSQTFLTKYLVSSLGPMLRGNNPVEYKGKFSTEAKKWVGVVLKIKKISQVQGKGLVIGDNLHSSSGRFWLF